MTSTTIVRKPAAPQAAPIETMTLRMTLLEQKEDQKKNPEEFWSKGKIDIPERARVAIVLPIPEKCVFKFYYVTCEDDEMELQSLIQDGAKGENGAGVRLLIKNGRNRKRSLTIHWCCAYGSKP
jgi:hypothetical protein